VEHVEVEVKLSNPFDGQSLTVRALVDRGATFTVVPDAVARQLHLPLRGAQTAATAQGRITLDRSLATLELLGKTTDSPVLINPHLDRVLIGVLTLEALGLKVNPMTGGLEETEVFLL
jgi:clan AA aspartic protease